MNNPYTVAELAERWKCSTHVIYAMIRSGELRSFTLHGKLLRISAKEVDKHEEGCDKK